MSVRIYFASLYRGMNVRLYIAFFERGQPNSAFFLSKSLSHNLVGRTFFLAF